MNPAYPEELKTLGDHLRKERLDKNLLQSDVAKLLGVTTDTVICWELNHNQPSAKLAKRIVSFLGYFPFPFEDIPLHKQLFYARLVSGKTQKEVAQMIGCDASNLGVVELGRRKPKTYTMTKIQTFISSTKETFIP